MKMIKQPEGAAELAVYFEPDIPDETKAIFMRYVHEHLLAKTLDVLRLRHYVCPRCGSPVKDREAAWERLRQGMKDILCVRCEARIPLLDVIESSLASNEFHRRVQEMREQACTRIDEESTELVVEAHVMSVVSEAGQILRRTSETNRGIDGEIEFKDYRGDAAGRRLYLQLRSGDYYGRARRQDGAEVFTIREARWAKHWRQCVCPVMLVIRMSDGAIRWMDVSEYLKRESRGGKKEVEQIVFEGEPLTALNLLKLREKLVGPPPIP